MLEAIGVEDVDELFADIPAELRLDRPLELPDGLPETEVFDHLAALAARNADADSEICFIGAGMYDHYVPAIVDAIISRSEFLTPYTPYQPEVSQGGLQVMFEFQTAISELTALPVSNASLYEGPSSVASAAYLALGAKQGPHAAWSSRAVSIRTPGDARDLRPRLRRRRWSRSGSHDGLTDAAELANYVDEDVAAVFVQNPNFLGSVEDLEALAAAAHESGALCVASVDADHARRPEAARRVRRRRRRRRGPAARQPPRLRRPVVRLLRRHRGAPAPDAGPDRRRDHRRRRPPRLRARAADARAAHPPREGDPQHLHLAGAERARRDDLPGLARHARLRRARRAAGPPHRLRARAPRRGRRRRAAPRRPGGARVRGPPRRAASPPCSTASPPRGSPPATRSRATTPSTRTGCWSRSPSAARRPTSTASPTRSARAIAERSSDERRESRDGAVHDACRPPATAEIPDRRSSATPRRRSTSAPSRAGAQPPLPDADVPETPLSELIPASVLRERRPGSCPRSPSPRSSATTTASRGATSTSTPGPIRSARAR